MSKILVKQARRFPERRAIAERYIERALPLVGYIPGEHFRFMSNVFSLAPKSFLRSTLGDIGIYGYMESDRHKCREPAG